jgi:hypothetical protein
MLGAKVLMAATTTPIVVALAYQLVAGLLAIPPHRDTLKYPINSFTVVYTTYLHLFLA